jgi:hypothetical protein
MRNVLTFPVRALLVLAVVVAACSPAVSPSSPPTAGPATAEPSVTASAEPLPSATAVDSASASLGGEWFCYGYQPGVGTNAVNVSGVIGGNTLQGSFHIEDASTYVSFYEADRGTYRLDPATSGISFDSGAMLGLAGTYGAGPNADLIDLHGTGNGWDEPFVVYLICQHA